jgi:hypothetical protein
MMLFVFGAAVVLVVVASVVLVVAPLRRPERLAQGEPRERIEDIERIEGIEREVQALRSGARGGGAPGPCPACGAATAPSWRWCAACGAPLDAFAASLAGRRPAADGDSRSGGLQEGGGG